MTTPSDTFYGPGNYATNNLLVGTRVRLGNSPSADPDACPDGTSNTVLFAEKYAACSYWALQSGREVPWYVADAASRVPGPARGVRPGPAADAPPGGPPGRHAGRQRPQGPTQHQPRHLVR